MIPPSSSSVNIQCKVKNCDCDQCICDDKCVQCRSNFVSSSGSTSESSCTPCPSGSKPSHPQSTCSISSDISVVKSAKEWRLFILNEDVVKGSGWDLKRISYYSEKNCYNFMDHTLGEAEKCWLLCLTHMGCRKYIYYNKWRMGRNFQWRSLLDRVKVSK